ncbi:uncharacterized protein PITG_08857 [Phytophthora infestans T30-4]|uniref:Uncharacterized protein n=1 Tax=Phytophthora infestans (strain T30-4) TaxID=403677 RepID=D0NDC6_PHYIT|nr:uncharacterized protein PITG_08857 [Phytophthora infestans T30-4]EEY56083.1 conserved hypothetical protein [Phytophthora infestans T30-4]|eukprot:XP_002902913.1 conserved hypothetical protein [Phytophthora infestans T30-4]
MVSPDNVSLTTTIMQSDVELSHKSCKSWQRHPYAVVEAMTRPSAQATVSSKQERESPQKAHHVLGESRLHAHKRGGCASKPERWVEITERLGSALSKELSAGGVRKHVDKLKKKSTDRSAQRSEPCQTTPMYTAAQEPHKSIDETDLERLVEVYVQKKDDGTLVQSKRTKSKPKKVAMTGPGDA